jgi:hypothetical protein
VDESPLSSTSSDAEEARVIKEARKKNTWTLEELKAATENCHLESCHLKNCHLHAPDDKGQKPSSLLEDRLALAQVNVGANSSRKKSNLIADDDKGVPKSLNFADPLDATIPDLKGVSLRFLKEQHVLPECEYNSIVAALKKGQPLYTDIYGKLEKLEPYSLVKISTE